MNYYTWGISDARNLRRVKYYLSDLPESLLARFFYGMLSAIDAFHSSGIIHRDIKSYNFLVSDNLMPSIG
jgi:serine/threonine protein kinase